MILDFFFSILHFNPFPHSNILDWSKLKAFPADNINVAETMISPSDMEENIVGKGENAGYQHFLLFSQCFQISHLFQGH